MTPTDTDTCLGLPADGARMPDEVSLSAGQAGPIWHTSDQLAVAARANLTTMSDHNDTRRSQITADRASLSLPAHGQFPTARKRLVHSPGGQGVAGSNPAVPTDFRTALGPFGTTASLIRHSDGRSALRRHRRWPGGRGAGTAAWSPSRASPSRSSPRPDRTVPIPFAGQPGLPD
jgi:hypothetical protein